MIRTDVGVSFTFETYQKRAGHGKVTPRETLITIRDPQQTKSMTRNRIDIIINDTLSKVRTVKGLPRVRSTYMCFNPVT